MKQYKITEKQRSLALLKLKLSPYSLVGDCLSYRAGYIRFLKPYVLDGRHRSSLWMIPSPLHLPHR